ncbi:hypothetical protein LOAG_13036 [Loa loa]|uniref:Uncharacterized protein n=1 Tax=Loa loa TaxID=7209 RepID=A0A1S0TK83_LOALO|nr:hypothetical protein LOAG_13036 [Loa loa]EFO15475.1 hypothetical protein LOAG_13036 [Loa loa]
MTKVVSLFSENYMSSSNIADGASVLLAGIVGNDYYLFWSSNDPYIDLWLGHNSIWYSILQFAKKLPAMKESKNRKDSILMCQRSQDEPSTKGTLLDSILRNSCESSHLLGGKEYIPASIDSYAT